VGPAVCECAAGDRVETGDASDLTLGRVICGNPSKALLSRRRLNPDAAGELDTKEHTKLNIKVCHGAHTHTVTVTAGCSYRI